MLRIIKPTLRLWLLVLPLVLLLVGLAAAFFLLSANQDLRQQASGFTYTKCKSDSQCNGAMLCLNGTCTSPTRCQMGNGNQGCPNGTFCDIGKTGSPVCIADSGCSTKKPCPLGYACDYSVGRPDGQGGTCRTAFGSCSDKKPCPLNHTCTNGACVKPFTATNCARNEVWDDLLSKCTKPISLCKNNTCPKGQECVNGGCLPEKICGESETPGGASWCKRAELPKLSPTRTATPFPSPANKNFQCNTKDPNACGGRPENCVCTGGNLCTGTVCQNDLKTSCLNQGRSYCTNYQGVGMSCCSAGYKCCDSGNGCCPN